MNEHQHVHFVTELKAKHFQSGKWNLLSHKHWT